MEQREQGNTPRTDADRDTAREPETAADKTADTQNAGQSDAGESADGSTGTGGSSGSIDNEGKKAERKIGWRQLSDKALVFFILALGALFILFLANFKTLYGLWGDVKRILNPVIIGAVIAYLCNPVLNFFENKVCKKIRHNGFRRGLSMFLTFLTFILLIAAVLLMIVPQLVDNITNLVNNYESYLDKLLERVGGALNKITENMPIDLDITSTEKVLELIEDAYGSIDEFVNKEIMPRVMDASVIETGWSMAQTVFSVGKDFLIGLFIAFYILASREKRKAQVNKALHAMFRREKRHKIRDVASLIDRSFGGFLVGNLIDAIIIGVLSYIFYIIFNVSDYNLLLAAIAGVTNVIPVFGPIIGAVPALLIVLISKPSKALILLIIILVVQQCDSNIIKPKILGQNTGISSLAVMVSITVCGALWGVVGMLIGVPVFAVVIELVKRYLEARLKAKDKPTDTMAYFEENTLVNVEQEVYYEHSGLRYRYEHGKLKPRVDRVLEKMRSRKNNKNKKKPDSAGSTDNGTDGGTAPGQEPKA